MDPDTALLPLCVALALLGLLSTVVLWRSRRASRGRILQGLAWTLVPVALYLTGLLRMAWDAVVALLAWAGRIVFSPAVWVGFTLLGVAVVLLVLGGVLVRRSHLRAGADSAGAPAAGRGRSAPAVGRGRGQDAGTRGASGTPTAGQQPAGKQAAGQQPSGKQQVDDEMAEIEALLKSRGIE